MPNITKISENNKTIVDSTVLGTVTNISSSTVAAGAVTSVNSKTGAVVLNADDLSDASTTNKFVTSTDKTNLSNLSGTNTGDQDISGIATNTSAITANTNAIATKQDTLVSGTNLKTINGETLLGSTDIVISGEQSSGTQYEIQYSDGAGGFDSNTALTTDANGDLSIFKQLNLGANGSYIREETGFGYCELKSNGQWRVMGDIYRWLTTGGNQLRTDNWTGWVQTYLIGSGQSVVWSSGITDARTELCGFTSNNAQVTTKHIHGFSSAGVLKAYIDKDGAFVGKQVTKTVTATGILLNTDRTVIVNSASATTQTMPTAASIAGVRMTIKNVGAGIVTLASDGSETFDVSASLTINQYECYVVESDGTNWIIVSKF